MTGAPEAMVFQSVRDNDPRAKVQVKEQLQVLGIEKLVRAEGYRLPGYESFAAKVSRNGYVATGFGEDLAELAQEKALSEAIERVTLKEFARTRGIVEKSNGWSCHPSPTIAVQNCVLELIERDVALTAWQNGGPYYELPRSLWPEVLRVWQERQTVRPEFFDLKVLMAYTEKGACISALLFNDRGNFVAGHASGLNLELTILSATTECMRAAHAAIRFEHLADVTSLHSELKAQVQPGAHSVAYAYTRAIPREVRVVNSTEPEILDRWAHHEMIFREMKLESFEITYFQVGDRTVARVKSERFREVFWGKDLSGLCHQNNSPHIVG